MKANNLKTLILLICFGISISTCDSNSGYKNGNENGDIDLFPGYAIYPFFLKTATACSQETVLEFSPVSNVVDGKYTTIWHTGSLDNSSHQNSISPYFKPGVTTGHWIEIDLGSSQMVRSLSYIPRQDYPGGRVTRARIYVSEFGDEYTEVTSALLQWETDNAEKRFQFEESVEARYVLLLCAQPANLCTAAMIAIEVECDIDTFHKWRYATSAFRSVMNYIVIGNEPLQYNRSTYNTAINEIRTALEASSLSEVRLGVDAALNSFRGKFNRYSRDALSALYTEANAFITTGANNPNLSILQAAVNVAANAIAGNNPDSIHEAYIALTSAINTFRGKRLTPIMGWSSWNAFYWEINEQLLFDQMDALVSTGLAAVGYNFFNIDDGFFGGRAATNPRTIMVRQETFPNGMKVFADRAHSMGLYAGIYTDGGHNTCASYDHNSAPFIGEYGRGVGLYGFERQDLRMYLIDWGYDFIKVDWCGGNDLWLPKQAQYTLIGNEIELIRRETGKYKVYNICCWEFPGPWVVGVADSWRTGADITADFASVLYQIDMVIPLSQYHGPGHVNDMDMMHIGNGMTIEEDKSHFTMWCMMSTPLMIGSDLSKLSEQTLSILKNTELIAINQDPACLPAYLVKQVGAGQTWLKDLGYRGSPNKAVTLLNRSNEPLVMTVNFNELGFSGAVNVRDLWAHQNLDVGSSYTVTVAPHGVVALKVTSRNYVSGTHVSSQTSSQSEEVVILDVRTLHEYNEGHIESAIHIPHNQILARASDILINKDAKIIVYCHAGKRSAQALNLLNYLGYTNVVNIGSMRNWYN